MKYRIEIGGSGAEVLIGKVKREFYDLFQGLDISEYAWNHEFFEDNKGVEIPEDIRPFQPGEWFNCNRAAQAYGVLVDEAYVNIIQDDDVLYDDEPATSLSLECRDDIFPDEILDEGDAYISVESTFKGVFFSYEFETDFMDIEKLILCVTDVNGFGDLITGVEYDGKLLEELGDRTSVDGIDVDASLYIVGD
jgi:hypothetical protein